MTRAGNKLSIAEAEALFPRAVQSPYFPDGPGTLELDERGVLVWRPTGVQDAGLDSEWHPGKQNWYFLGEGEDA